MTSEEDKDFIARLVFKLIYTLLGLSLVVVCYNMFLHPYYRVWSAGMEGKAILMKAEQEKQIIIEQAKAEVEAAKLRAEAIEAIGESAQKYPEYRTQEFIGAFAAAVENGAIDQIIYVPTENNIPIVEAHSR